MKHVATLDLELKPDAELYDLEQAYLKDRWNFEPWKAEQNTAKNL